MNRNRNWGNERTSKGEELIINLLKTNQISFEREKSFSDMKKHGNHLRFDFFIPQKNIAIEFNGEVHYYFIPFFHKNKQGFKKRQEYDRYKISYCLSHNIKLYIIPFWEINNLYHSSDIFQEKFLAKDIWKNDKDWNNYKKI